MRLLGHVRSSSETGIKAEYRVNGMGDCFWALRALYDVDMISFKVCGMGMPGNAKARSEEAG